MPCTTPLARNNPCEKLVYLHQCLYSYLIGFTGTNCEINIDDCRNNECQNGAVCVDGIEEYTCQCTPQWTGKAYAVIENCRAIKEYTVCAFNTWTLFRESTTEITLVSMVM